MATNAALLGTKTAIEGRSYLGPQMAQDALVGAVMFGTMGFMMRAGIQGRVAEAASDSGLAGALAGQVRRMGGSLESRLAEAAESSPFAKLAARTGAHLAAASDAGVARRIGGAVQGAAMSGMGSVTVGTLLASTAPGTWSNGVAAGLRQVASRVATGAKLSIPLGVATGFAMPPAEASAAPGAAPEAESTASLGGTRPDPKWLLLHSAGGEAHRLVNMLLFNRSASGGAAGRSALPVLEGEPLSGTSDKPGGKGG